MRCCRIQADNKFISSSSRLSIQYGDTTPLDTAQNMTSSNAQAEVNNINNVWAIIYENVYKLARQHHNIMLDLKIQTNKRTDTVVAIQTQNSHY